MIYFKDLVTESLFILFLTVSLIQIAYYWISYRRVAFFKSKEVHPENRHVSVIICAKNEVNNLKKNLLPVLEQSHPDYEVIVINDCSWDESSDYLDEMAKQYKHLKIVTIKEQEKYRHGKKFALTLGIKAAASDILVMTDADCMPAGKNWLSSMQAGLQGNTEIVLGYGAYKKAKGFLNRLIRFDTFTIAVQFLSAACGGNAYMGVGRNLAYRKSLFFRSKGFAKHNHIFSGDDDLFVNENATSMNTKIEINPEAFTYSEPKTTFAAWVRQKRRHQSTGKYYKTGHKFSLFFKWLSAFLFYGLLITLIFLGLDWRLLLIIYGSVLILKIPILWKCADRLKERDLFWMFPVMDFIYPILQLFFYFSNLFSKQQAWK